MRIRIHSAFPALYPPLCVCAHPIALSLPHSVCPISRELGEDDPEEVTILHSITKDELELKWSPRDVLRHFMQYMCTMAKNSMQIALDSISVVLSVPVWSTPAMREQIREVAEDAGFDVLHMICEPTAVTIAYSLDDPKTHEHVLVYRAGGLSTDITVLENSHGLLSIVYNKHINTRRANGNELTKQMVTYLAKEFFNKYKLDPLESRNAVFKLTQNAEQCKHILSSMPTAQIFIDSLMDGIDWECKMTRARYEHLIQGTCQQYLASLDDVYAELEAQCGLTEADIKKVVLCGGSMKIPLMQQLFRKRCSPDTEVLFQLCGDEVISIGCATHSQALGGLKAFDSANTDVQLQVNCLLESILLTRGDQVLVEFEESDILPVHRKFNVAKQEGEAELSLRVAKKGSNAEMGVLTVNVSEAAGPDVECVAHLRENGSIAIHVHA